MRRSTLQQRYGSWALVTGAARGLGAEFARQLAAEGFPVVLVDVDEVGLGAVARELEAHHGVGTKTITVDLADAAAVGRLSAELNDREIGLLVSNAAQSAVGRFLELPLEAQLAAIAVNCAAPTLLAHRLGARMAARGRGAIVLVSSLAAFQGAPLVATYAATKAYNLVLAESLWAELGERGIDVLAVAPGPTATPGYLSSAPAQGRLGALLTAAPREVVAETLLAIGRGPTLVAGRLNRLTRRLGDLLGSRRVRTAMFAAGMRRIYPQR